MANTQLAERLRKVLASFEGLWEGGYCEGDPLDPMSRSTYGVLGYMSVLHVVYLTCIKPYVTDDSIVLEIGPGRGAWTKAFLHAKEVWCLDALSAEHNRFWDYVGRAPHIRYFQVSDFSCSMLPENKFDYLFSYGTFCHIPFEGITEYMKNLHPKMKTGAHCFVMLADYEKYNSAWDNGHKLNIINAIEAIVPKIYYGPVRRALTTAIMAILMDRNYAPKTRPNINEDNEPLPGRLYHAGIERTCNMLKGLGYEIVDPDVGAVHRDPIIHFVKT